MRHVLHLDPGDWPLALAALASPTPCRLAAASRLLRCCIHPGKGPARVKLVSLVRARPAGLVSPAGPRTQARPRDRVRYCSDVLTYITYI